MLTDRFIRAALGIMRSRTPCGEETGMWEIVRAGGLMMGPIILFSVVALAIILERLWTLQDRRVFPPRLDQRGLRVVGGNQGRGKGIQGGGGNFPLGKMLGAGAAH